MPPGGIYDTLLKSLSGPVRAILSQEVFPMNHRKTRPDELPLKVVRVILVIIILVSLWQIGSTLWSYRQGTQTYESIRQQVTLAAPAAHEGQEEADETPALDFETLRSLYPDTVAWLSCADTPIDYPVMQASNNDYYLRRLPDGTWNNSGSLFLDYRDPGDFSGALSSIYGHNMKDGSMFACLENYADQEYYDKHSALTLETGQTVYVLQPLYGFVITAQQWVEQGYDQESGISGMMEYAQSHTTFNSLYRWTEGTPLVALITCTSRSDEERYILLCQRV